MVPVHEPAPVGSARPAASQANEMEALRRERDLLSAVLDTAGALVVLLDREGRIVRFNRACEKTTGYSFEEVRGQALWDLFLVPEEVEPVRQVFEHLRAGQFPNEHENYWRTKSGDRRLIAWSNTALLGGDGVVDYVIGTGIDITEHRQADEALRRARDQLEQRVTQRTAELQQASELLAALHETALGVVSRLDISELLRAIVERAEDLVGAGYGFVYLVDPGSNEIEAKVGTGLYAKYVGGRLKRGEGLAGQVWQLGRPLAVEDYVSWPGRSARFAGDPIGPAVGVPLTSGAQVVGILGLARFTSAPAFRQDEIELLGRFAQLASIALDNARLYGSVQQQLAELQQAQRALQESEVKFRGIVEYANIGIAIVQDARFRFVNPHYAAMLGYAPEEMIGNDFMRYCTPDERERIVDMYTRRARGEPVPNRYQTAMVHKNGRHVYAEVSAGIIPYEGREATFVFLRDITEEREAKHALEEAYRTLEQRVEERTCELAVLNSIAAVVSGSLDLKEIMAAALDKIREALGMEFGTAYGLEGGREQGEVVPASSIQDPLLAGQEAVARMMQAPQEPPSQNGETGHLTLLAYRGVSDQYADFVGDVRLTGAVATLARVGKPFVWLIEDVVPPDSDLRRLLQREECRQVVTLPLVAKGKLVGAINLGTRTPRTFTPEQLALLASISQQVGVAVENARLYEAEQSRRAEAERRRQVAEGMREVLAMLNSRQSLQETLDFIARQVCRLLGCGAGAIWRLQDDLLKIQAACGLDPEYAANMTLRRGIGGAGRALLERRPTIIAHLEDERLAGVSGGPFELLLKDYRSVLSVPLIVQGKDYGAMSLYYSAPREFSEEDLDLARNATYQVALAIETARLREQAAQAAVMDERGRLARELHDSVTQSLYSVTMYTEAAARLLASGKAGAAEYLRDARDTAQEALREMRLLIYQLRPPALQKGGLAEALQVRLDAVERRGGVRAELLVEGEDRLPPDMQAELHQIAQEALNNTLKHARARAVHVHLHFGEAMTRLEVQDDGVGFDLSATPAGGGLGLPGMQERVQKLGGRLQIESAPGQGTKVLVEIPTRGGE